MLPRMRRRLKQCNGVVEAPSIGEQRGEFLLSIPGVGFVMGAQLGNGHVDTATVGQDPEPDACDLKPWALFWRSETVNDRQGFIWASLHDEKLGQTVDYPVDVTGHRRGEGAEHIDRLVDAAATFQDLRSLPGPVRITASDEGSQRVDGVFDPPALDEEFGEVFGRVLAAGPCDDFLQLVQTIVAYEQVSELLDVVDLDCAWWIGVHAEKLYRLVDEPLTFKDLGKLPDDLDVRLPRVLPDPGP